MSETCINITEGLKNPLKYKYLFIGNKELTEIPASISLFKNLVKIIATENKLTYLPEEIGELSKLEMLHLSSNQLSALPGSLAKCKKLTLLYIDNNQFANLPEWLCSFTEMSDLLVNNNQLKELSKRLGNLTKLDLFSCANNKLAALPSSMKNCIRLRSFRMHSNNFKEFPKELKYMKDLDSINISFNPVSMLPDWLAALKSLQQLYIYKCQLTEFPYNFLNLIKDRWFYLYLQSNRFKDVSIKESMPKLKLYIKGNPIRFRYRLKLAEQQSIFRYLSFNPVNNKKKNQYAQKAAYYLRNIRYKLNLEFRNAGIIRENKKSFDDAFFENILNISKSNNLPANIHTIIKAYKLQISNLKILGYTKIADIERLECPEYVWKWIYEEDKRSFWQRGSLS